MLTAIAEFQRLKKGASLNLARTIWAAPEWPQEHTHKLWDERYNPEIRDGARPIPMREALVQARATIATQAARQRPRTMFVPTSRHGLADAVRTQQSSPRRENLKRMAQQALQEENDE